MTDPEQRRPDRPAGIVEYRLPGDWQVLAGRTDAANEYLSLRLARQRDLWFHIRGMPGGHVVLRVPEGAEPDRATEELAAAIAAFHSKARTAGTVAVSCTEGRNVSKPAGAKPGTVTIAKERVLKVRPLTEAAATALRQPGPS
jgi:predicted ribosome quality control (RQC) complex YloA/Tae2 family protein